MAKKAFVSAALLLSSCALAWGQTGTYGTGDNTVNITANNSTLTINVTGDATAITDIGKNIETAILAGNYSTIKVAGGQINSEIVHSILYQYIRHDEYHSYFYKNEALKTIDLGTTTVTDFDTNTFKYDNVRQGNCNLETITLPLATRDADGKMTVPSTVLSFTTHNDQSKVKTVIVPEGYTNIGEKAFYGFNTSVDFDFTISLPQTLKAIDTEAFYKAEKLKDITLPEGLVTIGKRAFMDCTSLTDPKFPSTLKDILSEAYSGILNIKNIKFNENLEFIGNCAFYCNSAVTECQPTITFPSSLKYMGPGAFHGRRFEDIYFNSETAPISPIGQLSSDKNLYLSAFEAIVNMGNNGFNPCKGEISDDAQNLGFANRENYKNGEVYFTMLHFPEIEEIGEANAETYTDITREYTTKFNPDGTFSYWSPFEVGKEKILYSFNNYSLLDGDNIRKVNPGYIDTYRGKQYIWPSQSQWQRSYVCNSLGYKWDGVTEYRPTLTDDHIALMIKDGLIIKNVEDKEVIISEDANTFTYDDKTAAEHNATLPGAVTTKSEKSKAVYYTQDEADKHNDIIHGAIHEGDKLLYTKAEVDNYNATLPGAVKPGDVQTAGHDDIYYGEDEYDEYMVAVKAAVDAGKIPDNNIYMTEDDFKRNLEIKKNNNYGCWEPVSFIKSPKSETIYYTEETANAYNLTLDNARKYDDVKGTATAEQAKEYNRTLPDAWTTLTIKTEAVFYTEQEAYEHNAKLTRAVKAGMTTSSAKAYADELSKIAYMGTRQFVLVDADHEASNDYKVKDVQGGYWWTLCVPFNMTKKQIDEVFGSGTHVCRFSEVDRDDDSNEKKITLKFQHDVYAHKTLKEKGKYAKFDKNADPCKDNDTVIYAHESYMIHPTKTNEDAVFVVKNYEPITGSPLPTIVNANDGTEYRFIGNYTTEVGGDETVQMQRIRTVTIPKYSYMYAKKKNEDISMYKFWFYNGGSLKWSSNKCVVQATAKDGGAKDYENFFGTINQAKQFSVFGSDDIDDKPTEIEHVEIIAGEQPQNGIKYDLYGRRVSDNYKGIYIMNGKKYINR